MNTRTDNTQNTVEELRQAARRLGDGAAYVAREVPWATLLKGTFTLAINILRYSMGIAIYGLIIWPYRILAPVGAGIVGAAPGGLDDADEHEKDAYAGPYYDPVTGEESFIRVPGSVTFDGRTVGYDSKLY
jgi:hypothetical protein